MLLEVLNVDFQHKDDRGTLIQLVHKGYSQFNIITSKKGVFRGGHFHKYNTEAFFIINGKCKVTVEYNGLKEEKTFKTGDFFRIAPYIIHSFDYLEDSVMASMYSLGVELSDGQKDIFAIGEDK